MFKVGDKVVCIQEPITKEAGISKHRQIKVGEVFEVLDIFYRYGKEYLKVNSDSVAHDSRCFRKIDDKFAGDILAKIAQEVEEEELILN